MILSLLARPPFAVLVLPLVIMGTTAQETTAGLPKLPTASEAMRSDSTAMESAASTTSTPESDVINSQPIPPVTSGSDSLATTGSDPQITGSSVVGDGALTGLPTLTGAFTIVAPSVPPTTNAPYMRTSRLPEGTVFIAVGAILGFLAISVLLWRGLTAWSLHRSVKRAALHQNISDAKASFRTPTAPTVPFYKYSDRESTISLSGLGHKGTKKGGRPATSQVGTSTANLFFSPTAGAAGSGLSNPGNRGSNYLPAGYYAAGASAAGNAAGHGSTSGTISLSTLGPQSQGYSRAQSIGPSPPDSPYVHADGGRGDMASSSLTNLNQAYEGERAPSAYLDDLFDGDDAPPVPTHRRRTSASTRGPS